MREADYYPAGAYNDPRAPWNQKDPEYVECDECNGTGFIYYAYDFICDEETECTQETWNLLPEDEDTARANNQHFIRGERETCLACNGCGKVEDWGDEECYDDDRRDYWRDYWADKDD